MTFTLVLVFQVSLQHLLSHQSHHLLRTQERKTPQEDVENF